MSKVVNIATDKERKGTMTKKEMLNYIESTDMIINFDYKYLMRRDKDHITYLYNRAKEYVKKQERK